MLPDIVMLSWSYSAHELNVFSHLHTELYLHTFPAHCPSLGDGPVAVQVRLYRLPWLFRYLEYDLTIRQLWLTLIRNLLLVVFMTHWVACGFEFLARQWGFPNDLLVGVNPELFRSLSYEKQ